MSRYLYFICLPLLGILMTGCTSQESLYTPPKKPAPIVTEFVVNKNHNVLAKKIHDEYDRKIFWSSYEEDSEPRSSYFTAMNFSYSGDPEPFIDGGTLEYKSTFAFRDYQYSFPAAKKSVDYYYYDNKKKQFHITRNLNLSCDVRMELDYIEKEKTRVKLNFYFHLQIDLSVPQFPGFDYDFVSEVYDRDLYFQTNEQAVGVTSGFIKVIYFSNGEIENHFIKILTN